MEAIRKKAKDMMKGFCRVCPVCDGNACKGEVPGMGGLGTGSSFSANVHALADVRFNMRLVHDVTAPDTRVSVLDQSFDIPVLAAPIGGVSFNMGGCVSEEDYIASVLNGCHEAGIMGCVGDGVPDFIHQAGYAAIKKLKGRGIPFIKPWEDDEFYQKLKKARDAGAGIFGMDIDAAGLVTLKLMGRPVSPKPVEKLRELIARVPGKFILKGVMTPDEARLAVDAGADAIVVSNHGGRVLDHTPGGARVLPGIAKAVKGRLTVFADGGVRTGADVLKMLALGADAVMIGRPFSIAAVGGGKEGVIRYIEKLKIELVSAMVLTGVSRADAVDESILYSEV